MRMIDIKRISDVIEEEEKFLKSLKDKPMSESMVKQIDLRLKNEDRAEYERYIESLRQKGLVLPDKLSERMAEDSGSPFHGQFEDPEYLEHMKSLKKK